MKGHITVSGNRRKDEIMKIYITRHGQVDLETKYWNGDVNLPIGEAILSELGKQQAVLVGKRLKELGFSGKILSSPFVRTMQTAELIAKETGSEIWPTDWMHEIFRDEDAVRHYKGYTLTELRRICKHIAEDAQLKYPWWTLSPEDKIIVQKRIARGIDRLLKEQAEEEVLLVGHAASAGAAHNYLQLGGEHTWNCCLGMYDSEHPDNNFGRDVSFIPEHMVSANAVMAMDINLGKNS